MNFVWIILCWYALTSAAAFIAFALDKRAAIQSRPRTPERTLHLLELIGGWPSAWLAIALIHHKKPKGKLPRGDSLGHTTSTAVLLFLVRSRLFV